MGQIKLNKFLAVKEILNILNTSIDNCALAYIRIFDNSGHTVYERGDSLYSGVLERHIIVADDSPIGQLEGINCSAVLSVLHSLLRLEEVKRSLASETLDKYREMSLMYEISTKLARCIDIDEVINLILYEAHNLIKKSLVSFHDSGNNTFLESSIISIMLYNEESGLLQARGLRGSGNFSGVRTISPEKGIIGMVYQSGNPEIVNDVSSDPRHFGEETGISSILCTPLRTKDRVIGVLCIMNERPVTYLAKDLTLFSVLAATAASPIENSILHERRIKEERIKSNLERYIAPQVVRAVIESTGEMQLSPAKREIAMLFSDIRQFSTVCEMLAPERIVGYLNEYFTHMVEVIFKYGGTLNKFVGDMIFAFFGAPKTLPDKEYLAIMTAIEMQRTLQNMPTQWVRDNFKTGIGIGSGSVVVGNVGSPKHSDYTAIGDDVNIAERLQAIASGGQILVTRSVHDAVSDKFRFKAYGDVSVKGRKKTVEIFEVIYL